MAEFRRITFSALLISVLQITAAETPSSSIVRVGDEVTLPCESWKKNLRNCSSTTWIFSDSGNTATVELIKHGKIEQNVKSKPDRLSVTENCSLVIKKVTDEDVGLYICRQYISGQEHKDAEVYLSVVNMTEHKDNDKVTLNCSVWTHERCRHKVKWLFMGKEVDEDNKQGLKTSQSTCSANVTFTTLKFIYKPKTYNLLKCDVTDGYTGEVQQFTFSPQSSDWWRYVIVTVCLAALIITAVALVRWKKTKANKTCMDDNTTDPEDGVSYASVSFTKKSHSKGWIWGKDKTVIYSTVKAGASTDPDNLYATIN